MTIEQMIRAEAERQGVPPDLAVAVARRESGLNPNVSDGSSGEIGLFQVKPTTGADLGYFNLRDLQSNIAAGVAYLKWNHSYLGGDWSAAVLGYNAGPGNVTRGTISQAAYSYLAWIESQVPGLFGGGDTVMTEVTGGGTPVAQTGTPRGGAGTELLDPNFWSWQSPLDPQSTSEPPPVLLAAGAVLGLAAVLWAIS